jgi:hypothetical protein
MDNNDYYSSDWSDKGRVEFIETEKKVATSILEKAGFIMAAVIMLVVIVVMTSDIKIITFKEVTELSLSFFVLIFCSYSMYGNMYHSGMLAGRRLGSYKKVSRDYITIRDDIKTKDVQKQLAAFCKEYVDNELKSRREALLENADVTWEEYQECKHLSKKELQYDKKLSKVKIKAISDANWIVPIKLEPAMLYKQGGQTVRRSPLHTAPSTKRTFDFIWNLVKTGATSLCMCFIAFELFSEPSWEMFCAVAIKLLTVALNGYAGYRRGYDNIAVDTVNYTEDQIDMLEQFKKWRGEEVQIVSFAPTNPLIANTTND